MKLTYKSYEETVTLETEHDDITMDELFQYFKQLSLGIGFASETVSNYFDPIDEKESIH